jgi:hypothetical protein
MQTPSSSDQCQDCDGPNKFRQAGQHSSTQQPLQARLTRSRARGAGCTNFYSRRTHMACAFQSPAARPRAAATERPHSIAGPGRKTDRPRGSHQLLQRRNVPSMRRLGRLGTLPRQLQESCTHAPMHDARGAQCEMRRAPRVHPLWARAADALERVMPSCGVVGVDRDLHRRSGSSLPAVLRRLPQGPPRGMPACWPSAVYGDNHH